MIPICLVTGFLGTGKTTLLTRIVAQNRDRRLIYLINEFSALDVDGAIVSDENPDVVSIPGGSIFCKCLVTEFIEQMNKIHEQHADAEGVVIEASGMADPRVIADMLKETGLGEQFELSNIISIVEPRSFLRLIHTLPNIIHQVEAADTVLLNKCDLYDEHLLNETEKAVRAVKPAIDLIRCIKGEADLSICSDTGSYDCLHGEYAKCRDPRYSVFSIKLPAAVSIEAIKALIVRHEEDVFRVKGYIQSDEGDVYFDYSKAGFTITPGNGTESKGLAWIIRGDAGEILNPATVSDSLGMNI